MSKYRNRYIRESKRLQRWNYGWSHPYFLTICTKGRVRYFGEVRHREMILSEIGKIAHDEWLRTPTIRPDMNLELGAFIVMPDHFHCVITIGRNPFNKFETQSTKSSESMEPVQSESIAQNQFGPQSKNIASIMRGFKSAVTMQARVICPSFAWQPRFHDHIIRSQEEHDRIEDYILDNPMKWKS